MAAQLLHRRGVGQMRAVRCRPKGVSTASTHRRFLRGSWSYASGAAHAQGTWMGANSAFWSDAGNWQGSVMPLNDTDRHVRSSRTRTAHYGGGP
jgi:hypothetical protein